MSEEQKSQQQRDDDQIEDLAVDEKEAEDVKGGLTVRKAGKEQQEYLKVTMEDVQISS